MPESSAEFEDRIALLTGELNAAREQQAATADMFKVISQSAFDLDAVLAMLIRTGIRLCDAVRGVIWLRRGEQLFLAAHVNYPDEWVAAVQDNAITPSADAKTISGLAAFTGEVVNSEDVLNDPRFRPLTTYKFGDYRAELAVPLKRDGMVRGVISLSRLEARLFTEDQIKLVQIFADQAVIAIENVRLCEEVQTKTSDLEEARTFQKATSGVLEVIGRSASNLQPVLDVIVDTAADLCRADMAVVRLMREGMLYHVASSSRQISAITDYSQDHPTLPKDRSSVAGRVALEGQTIHIPDIAIDAEYTFLRGLGKASVGAALGVPLFRGGKVDGVLVLLRKVARSFTDRQIDLVQTFADQAVIAIENVRLFEEVQARNREVTEALEQQTATSDVLKAISRSAFDLCPVLQTLVDSAVRLSGADMGAITLREGNTLRFMAGTGQAAELHAYERTHPHPLGRGTFQGRAALEGSTIHVPNVFEDAEYERPEAAILGNFRSVLSVPLKRGQDTIGVFGMARRTAGPFAQRQIELVETFADQAVIAIENARLFEEVQARNREISEALEQQTATGAILRVIAASPTDIQPVLRVVAESAARFCDTHDAVILLRENDNLVIKAHYGPIPLDLETVPIPIARDWVTGRAFVDRKTLQVEDLTASGVEFPRGRYFAERTGHRTTLATPLMRHDEAIGALTIRRNEVRPFSDKQIDLVKTFADQAVIAIENVRLFEEVRARTAELTELLQQQTATADVLKVISRSTYDLQKVLDALAMTATRSCEADKGAIMRGDGELYRFAASAGFSKDLVDYAKAHPLRAGHGSATSRAVLESRTIHLPDVLDDPDYTLSEYQRLGEYRTLLAVPLLREGAAIGVFVLARTEVRPFSTKQIELVETFADQAVIAIENVRLFTELEEALQQQTATADVLKVISRSAFDLQAVLDTLNESAVRLCRADKGCLERLIDGGFRYASTFGFPPGFRAYADAHQTQFGRGSAVGRAAAERRIIHIEDVLEDREYTYGEIAAVGAMRTVLAVPLLRQDELIGAFAMVRTEARPFTAREIELVKTFADQAVIAIENVRLFDEVQARTQELAKSLEDLRTAQDRLIQTEKLASLGQLTAGIAHEIKNPLNFVNNFASLSSDLLEELAETLDHVLLDDAVHAEVGELMNTLKGNLAKVEQHGKRADSIVKNMLLHSRAGSIEHRPTTINVLVEESLNLAYHGARAETKDFNITLERSFDPDAGEVDLFPQEITRVLLNLISNGFYATRRRGAEASGTYEPVLKVSTVNLGDRVEIRIRDNGTGIPVQVKEKMFNPFFTTKPAGEGTGLGLSISHDIVVKQHAGTIEVDTKPGEFTEFRIALPRGAASLAKTGDLP